MVLTQIYKSIGPATQCPDQTHIGIISQTTKWQYRHVQPLEGHLVSTSYRLHQISQLAAQLWGHGWNI